MIVWKSAQPGHSLLYLQVLQTELTKEVVVSLLGAQLNQEVIELLFERVATKSELRQAILDSHLGPNYLNKLIKGGNCEAQVNWILKDPVKNINLLRVLVKDGVDVHSARHFIQTGYTSLSGTGVQRLKLIDLLFSVSPQESLLEVKEFWRDIEEALCNFSDSLGCKVSINILKVLLQRSKSDKLTLELQQLQVFTVIYETLDQFAIHLTKGVWPDFKLLLVQSQLRVLSRLPPKCLFRIIFKKIMAHPNIKLVKYAIKSIIGLLDVPSKYPFSINYFFTQFETFLFQDLFAAFNLGLLYSDTPFHLDSPLADTLAHLFLTAFESFGDQQYSRLVRRLVRSFASLIELDQAWPSFWKIFKGLQRQSKAIQDEEILLLCKVLETTYPTTNLSKRVGLLRGYLSLFSRHLGELREASTFWRLLGSIPKELSLYQRSRAYKESDQYSVQTDMQRFISKLYQSLINEKEECRYLVECVLAHTQPATLLPFLTYSNMLRFATQSHQHSLKLLEARVKSCSESAYATALQQFNCLMAVTAVTREAELDSSMSNLVKFYLQLAVQENQHYLKQKPFVCQALLRIVPFLFGSTGATRVLLTQFINSLFVMIFGQLEKEPSGYLSYLNSLLVSLTSSLHRCLDSLADQEQPMVQTQIFQLGLQLLLQLKHKTHRALQNDYLRLLAVVLPLLSSDQAYSKKEEVLGLSEQTVQDCEGVCESFSYEHLEQLFVLLKEVVVPHVESVGSFPRILKIYSSMRQFITQHLGYNYSVKQIHSLYEFALDPRLARHSAFMPVMLEVVKDAVSVGRNYWLFHRKAVLSCVQILHKNSKRLMEFKEVIAELLVLDEYRGYQNGIVFGEYELKLPFLLSSKRKMPSRVEYFGCFGRYMTLELLLTLAKEGGHAEQLVLLSVYLIQLLNGKQLRGNIRFSTVLYFKKLHIVQALCITLQVLPLAREHLGHLLRRKAMLLEALSECTHNVIRAYMEIAFGMIFCQLSQQFKDQVSKVLQEPSQHQHLLIPLMLMAGLIMLKDTRFQSFFFYKLWPFTFSHQAYNRGVAQFFCFRSQLLQQDKLLSSSAKFFQTAKENVKMNNKIQAAVTQLDEYIKGCSVQQLFQFHIRGETPKSCHQMLKLAADDMITQLLSQGRQQFQGWNDLGKQLLAQLTFSRNDFQKKMCPLQDELTQFREMKNRSQNRLIVVGSLLQKIPNIGHLVRTCEVFNVEMLTIPDSAVLQDQDFKKISVTGQKWLNILQVKEEQVANFLALKKALGYQIVGLQQTQHSKPMQSFSFPKKCVLLLGNEKKGSPVQLIQMLDKVVQIPQFGKVRSLNVHVSAVISIWQYIKQSLK